MKGAIMEDLRTEGFISNNEEGEMQGEEIIRRMFELMENKRTITKTVVLQRKIPKIKKV